MLKFDLYNILIIAGIIFVALVTFGLIIARLYRRSSKEISFVRTGWGGEKVILGGGAIVLPVLHEIIPVNMNTLRLEVRRADDQALITRDRMRVDVMAEFYVRVKPTADSIATAAQTLGQKTMSPNELKNLVEGKFVDSLRAVAAEMAMEELHEKRVDFVQKVQQVVSEDLHKNGLELETVSLTGLDQTGFKYFNPQNAFDAEGLTKLTETIEDRRRKRNHIEQDTDLAIKTKNLEAEQARLQIIREEEYAKLQQEREIAIRRAEQLAEIAAQEAGKKREAEEAQIAAEREVELKRILAARDVENENIQKAQLIQKAQVEQKKTIELAEQDRAIAIAEKSRAESEAKAQADHARAQAVKAEEEVVTVRQIQQAERQKAVELVAAKEHAEKDAIAITVAAEAGKQAAADDAEAVRIAAEAEAEKVRLKAKGEADAKILLAQAMEKQYQVDAEGTRAVNEANNVLSPEQVEMQIRLAMLKYLPEIIRESVKPMENIDDIKILQVNGLHGSHAGSCQADAHHEGGNVALSDQVVNSALRYRSQAPLIDSLMSELGIQGGDINGMTQSLKAKT
ncbi:MULTISPECIES: flotillin family protein [Acinetobacter]|uniref:Flotillin family protein n=1 Tax=Acinetobacter pecorum TaxID=2762215 RepID=A0ABR8VTJ7_9GAMM|nr:MULTISPECIES: flotillin family protein [Acinetobacter]MBD8008090.1 flotillin family protein [Acinetobacter pecorum]OAL82986.1 flotillin [Acinetobacter sp. SFA]OAL85003.1 flotillin [Acinetobacter sp. SFD]